MLSNRFLSHLFLGTLFASYAIAAPAESSVSITQLPSGFMKVVKPITTSNFNDTTRVIRRYAVAKRGTINLSGDSCDSVCSGLAGYGPIDSDCFNMISALFSGTNMETYNSMTVTSYYGVPETCDIDVSNCSADTVLIAANKIGNVASSLTSTCDAAHGFASGTCTFPSFDNVDIIVRHT